MKKTAIFLSILAIAATAAFVATADDAVYSANTIGVIKYTVPAGGGLTCIALPLNPMSDAGEWVWKDTTLAEQLENDSIAYFWDGTAWQGSTKSRRGWSGVGATKVLSPNEAVFIRSPANSSADQTIALVGELPEDDTLSFGVTGGNNLDTLGVTMYPVSTKFADSELATALDNDSIVYFWDGSAWQGSTKSRRGWSGVGATWETAVGEGVFVRASNPSGATVDVTRPFD